MAQLMIFLCGTAFGVVLGAELTVRWIRPRLAVCRAALAALEGRSR